MSRPKESYTGTVFGRLVVVGDSQLSTPGRRYVEVRCECGTVKASRLDSLIKGATVSCGCSKKFHNLKHGHRRIGQKDPTYQTWSGMVQRCTNPKDPNYVHYGRRGIGVVESWLVFENFLRDMGPRPDDLTLERKDNNKGYSEDNCVWASKHEQSRNKRSNVWVEKDGKKMVLTDAARSMGLHPSTLKQRLLNDKT